MIFVHFKRFRQKRPSRKASPPAAPTNEQAPGVAARRARRISWILAVLLAPLAWGSPATAGPMMDPSDAAGFGAGHACLDGDFSDYFNENWRKVLDHLASKTTTEFSRNDPKRTYNLAARTDPFLSAAITCDEIPLFENLLDLYALAYPGLKRQEAVFLSGLGPSFFKKYSRRWLSFPARMWVHTVRDEKSGTERGSTSYFLPVENQLGSAKLVRAIARATVVEPSLLVGVVAS